LVKKFLELLLLNVLIYLKLDDAEELLKQRETISKEIRSQLFSKARDFNVNVVDVSFMSLSFSREYANAVERRAVQQQMAEKQKFIVLRDEELKNAQIIRSEAEAEAARLINESVRKYGSTQIEIKKLEAAQAIAESLSKNVNISFVPNNTGNLLNLRV
jgi:prohibitin 1